MAAVGSTRRRAVADAARQPGRGYRRGLDIDWAAFDAPYNRRRVQAPAYAFAVTKYWVTQSRARMLSTAAPEEPAPAPAGAPRIYDVEWRSATRATPQPWKAVPGWSWPSVQRTQSYWLRRSRTQDARHGWSWSTHRRRLWAGVRAASRRTVRGLRVERRRKRRRHRARRRGAGAKRPAIVGDPAFRLGRHSRRRADESRGRAGQPGADFSSGGWPERSRSSARNCGEPSLDVPAVEGFSGEIATELITPGVGGSGRIRAAAGSCRASSHVPLRRRCGHAWMAKALIS